MYDSRHKGSVSRSKCFSPPTQPGCKASDPREFSSNWNFSYENNTTASWARELARGGRGTSYHSSMLLHLLLGHSASSPLVYSSHAQVPFKAQIWLVGLECIRLG